MIGIKGIAKKPITDATAYPGDVFSGQIFYNNSGRAVGTYSPSVSSLEISTRIDIKQGSYQNSDINISDYTRIYHLARTVYDPTEGSGVLTTGSTNSGNPTKSSYSDNLCYNPKSVIVEYNFPNNTTYCTEIKIPHSSTYPYTIVPIDLYTNIDIYVYSCDLFNFYGNSSRIPVHVYALQSKKKIVITGNSSGGDITMTKDTYIECKFI